MTRQSIVACSTVHDISRRRSIQPVSLTCALDRRRWRSNCRGVIDGKALWRRRGDGELAVGHRRTIVGGAFHPDVAVLVPRAAVEIIEQLHRDVVVAHAPVALDLQGIGLAAVVERLCGERAADLLAVDKHGVLRVALVGILRDLQHQRVRARANPGGHSRRGGSDVGAGVLASKVSTAHRTGSHSLRRAASIRRSACQRGPSDHRLPPLSRYRSMACRCPTGGSRR